VVAAEQSEVESFLSKIVGRSRVKEAINGLLAARELSFAHVGNRSLIQVAEPRAAAITTKPARADDPRRRGIVSRP
jgi:hypothetical protein